MGDDGEGRRFEHLKPAKILSGTLIVYLVLDILLTHVDRLETRPVAKVTTLGFVMLGAFWIRSERSAAPATG